MVDSTLLAALLLALPAAAMAQPDEPVRLTGIDAKTRLERVEVVGIRPATMPTEIPTTTQSISGQQIERTINATDSQDLLKYFPSLNMRERYIGDDDQAVLATRASRTGNSTRSLGYADGILLSKLLGNGASWTPRWGLVTPEEIDRVVRPVLGRVLGQLGRPARQHRPADRVREQAGVGGCCRQCRYPGDGRNRRPERG